MSKRVAISLQNKNDREVAVSLVAAAPFGSRVEIKQPRRSDLQNDRMWALLRAISEQLVWHGNYYSPEHWKQYFLFMLNGEMWMPGEGGGQVPLISRSSDLSKAEMSDLMSLIEAFAARQRINIEKKKGQHP